MVFSPDDVAVCLSSIFPDHARAFVSRLGRTWNIGFPISMPNSAYRNAKSPASHGKPGFCAILTQDQPRVRERIMKLSKVYSATCHHRYWSER
jgi:hypothetical protein